MVDANSYSSPYMQGGQKSSIATDIKFSDLEYFRDIVHAEVDKLDKLRGQHSNSKYEGIAYLKAIDYFIGFLFSIVPAYQIRKILQDLNSQYGQQSYDPGVTQTQMFPVINTRNMLYSQDILTRKLIPPEQSYQPQF